MRLFSFQRSDREYRIEVRAFIKRKFQCAAENTYHPSITDVDGSFVGEVIQSIKEKLGKVKCDDKMHAILWIRWALTLSDHLISQTAIQNLGEWRAQQSAREMLLMQYRKPNGKWHGRCIKIENFGDVHGYTLDEILLDSKVLSRSELPVYSQRWRIKRFSTKDQRAKSPSDICGSNLMAELEVCVLKEVKSRRSSILPIGTAGGRYKCSISRAELINLLQKKYKKIRNYSSETLIRALPQFVECPRGRPGGKRQQVEFVRFWALDSPQQRAR